MDVAVEFVQVEMAFLWLKMRDNDSCTQVYQK